MFGRIRRGRFQLDTYLITLSDNPDNLLDMFSANVLKQPYFKKQKGIHAREIYVVGLAAMPRGLRLSQPLLMMFISRRERLIFRVI